MPLPVIADTYRVALNWVTQQGQHAANVLHFYNPAGTIPAMGTALDANVTAAMWGGISGYASVASLDIIKLDATSAIYNKPVTGAKWTGADAAAEYLPAYARVVSLRTGFRGRSRRGRLFLPFLAEDWVVNGVTTGSIAATQTAWNTWLAAMIASGYLPVVASYKLHDQEPITSLIYEAVPGIQRRRQERLR